jgi:hypothetical protein
LAPEPSRGNGSVEKITSTDTATTEDKQRVLRAVVQDILIGPEKLTIRHRIPVREHASGGGHHDTTTDTEGDMRESSLLRGGVVSPLLANIYLHVLDRELAARGVGELGGGNRAAASSAWAIPCAVRPAPGHPAVHALLTHLYDAGFRGAPRSLGIDERGREILAFIPGKVAWPGHFHLLDGDGQLRCVARLIRDFHDAAAGFTPAARRALAGTRAGRRERDHRPPRPGALEPRHRRPPVGVHRLGHRRTKHPALGPCLSHPRVRAADR